jgi:hypothetical protein
MNRGMIVITLAGLTLLSASMANAAEELYGGIKGGVNFANQSTDPDAELDSRTGMAVGGYVGIPVNNVLSVQPEGLFTMKGAETEGSSWKLNYIEVPVLARASFMNEASAHPAIFAGPAVGFNLSSKIEDDSIEESIDVKDETNPIDFGVVVGGGVDIPFSGGKNSVGVDLRYTLGLNNVNDSDSSEDLSVKNGVFQIMGSVGLF